MVQCMSVVVNVMLSLMGVFAILLLNVMEVLYWRDHVWSSKNVCVVPVIPVSV